MSKLWEVKNFKAQEIYYNLNVSKEFTVPPYQRTIVWKDDQKETFIDSLKKGYPFGSLLLYHDKNKGGYQIIDGLQRSKTISEFIENPTSFFNSDDIEFEVLDKIFQLANINGNKQKIVDQMSQILEDWLKDDYETMDKIQDLQFAEYAYKLSQEFVTLKGKEKEISELIKPSLSNFKKICTDLSEISIPAIVIETDEKELPIIFDRINSKGTQLSKYQIYAAKWTFVYFKLSNNKLSDKILDYIKKMYDERSSNGYEIEGYDPIKMNEERKVNFFDLIFGFGQVISNDFGYLFQSKIQSDTVVSAAFTLINSCLGYKPNEMDNLLENYNKKLDENDINKFLSEVYDSINYIDKYILRAITRFKSNKRESSTILHSENQIISMIATVFIAKFGSFHIDRIKNRDETILIINLNSTKDNWNQKDKDFKKNMLKYFVSDIISQKWKGSGDSLMYQIVFNENRYTREISWEEFENTFDSFVTKLNSERNEKFKVSNPKNPEKIILKLLYLEKFSAQDQFDHSKYDIEHLATKKIMLSKCQELDISLPISSIGNLCLLPEYENRSKKDKILYDDNQYINNLLPEKLSLIESKYTFTSRSDFDFLKANDATLFEKEYFTFLKKRISKIKEEIKNSLFRN